ncbi:hypothetical protein KAR91_12880 [Candidatus Pacearchaeota archaeon]|nr:hypothetical protein [Candidatus Pacearchaeota archaeon]
MDNETITNIINKAEQRGLSHFGLRVETKSVTVGQDLSNSTQFGDTWDGEGLDGTCAIQISYDGFDVEDINSDLKAMDMYLVDDCSIVLVGGTGSYEGTDAGETVITNAEVLHIFN